MNFLTLKRKVARLLNILDESDNTIMQDADISETSIGVSLNDAYVEDVVPTLKSQYPEFFRRRSYLPNYTQQSTVDSSSTGTNLVSTDNIFDVGYIGQYVHNVDLDTSAKILAFNSSTSVTLDATIGDDWDGDIIRIIDDWIPIEGDAINDFVEPLKVKTRYSSTDTRYITVTPGSDNDLDYYGYEVHSQADPEYAIGAVVVDEVKIDAVKIYPGFQKSDDKAIKLTYTESPVRMKSDDDEPRLPIGHHEFLVWKAASDGLFARGDFNASDRADAKYELGKERMIQTYRPTSINRAVPIKINRRAAEIFNKDY